MAKGTTPFFGRCRVVTVVIFLIIFASPRLGVYAYDVIKRTATDNVPNYAEDRLIEIVNYYIADNWLESSGRGDFNFDKTTNFTDFAILIELTKASGMLENISHYIADNWLSSKGRGDFNYDRTTNFTDFAVLVNLARKPKRPKPKPYISRDITGHPRDIPDAGAFEYRKKTAMADIIYYIVNNWLNTTGKGDFNHDGVTNLADYTILAQWWWEHRRN
jgi:hypothetical protein